MAEFGVYGVEDDGGTTIVFGRCYRATLAVGETFQLVTLLGPQGDEVERHTVNLTIERMVVYGREMEQIDEGLTAQLRLAGEGGERVIPQSVLRTMK